MREGPPLTAARVMIVEDEFITAMALKESLVSLGYEVVASVPSGEQAVETAKTTRNSTKLTTQLTTLATPW